ncbi:MAG TPA: nucleotidyltransferase domain-containing protein [Azoarcus taiwanensis]|nr:nucleotidyltransferase domain-containing protein [Azoarcus taiwanensis]
MRISDAHIRTIRRITAEQLGREAVVTLFGSRVDDTQRGGDIDLLLTVPHHVARPALTAARLAAKLERALDGRRVDGVLQTPETPIEPVHSIAMQHGIRL